VAKNGSVLAKNGSALAQIVAGQPPAPIHVGQQQQCACLNLVGAGWPGRVHWRASAPNLCVLYCLDDLEKISTCTPAPVF
jgi:hypothetical protein